MPIIPWLYFLKEDEQLLIEGLTHRHTVNGPGRAFVMPLNRARVRKGITLGPAEYLRVRHRLTGEVRNELGPKLYFSGANEEITNPLTALTLKKNQYVRLIDKRTGVIRVERGEQIVYPTPTEEVLETVRDAINVDDHITVLVRDRVSGQLSVIAEKQVFVPTPTQEIIETRARIPLKKNQYVRLIDRSSGVIRVERGEQSVYLGPTEEQLGTVQDGINIDEHHAVLVRDIVSGQLEIITTPQVFIPTPRQEIVETRQRILLEDYMTVIIKDKEGRYSFKRGSDAERAFFLPPYAEVVKFRWSSDIHKDKRNLVISYIDQRPKFMWYEFEARTQDNVELVIGITFFWQIVDVEAMVRTTDDTSGDVCSHARSSIIQAISQVSLEKFLAEFNQIVRDAVLGKADIFYTERGVKLHAIEVRSIACKEPETQRILQDIIQETTNRLNRLQKQESENEVKLKQLQGEIAAEERRGQLLEQRRAHAQTEAVTAGEAEAIKVKAFMDGLGDQLSAADKLAVFNTLRKQEALEALSKGNAQLYFTPADVDLSIEARQRLK